MHFFGRIGMSTMVFGVVILLWVVFERLVLCDELTERPAQFRVR